jgi:hypothetical protein
MDNSNQMRKNREEERSLFSMTHFYVFLKSACSHFSDSMNECFDFIRACPEYNPAALDLDEHLSNRLKYVKSPDELTGFCSSCDCIELSPDNYPPDTY